MPELPDVALFKRYLDSTALHKQIETVSVKHRKILQNVSSRTLARKLKGRQLGASQRHGKWLFAALDEQKGHLVFHFGMTGSLQFFKDPEDEPSHTRFLLHFANGFQLAFVCPRLLGRVAFIEDTEEYIETHALGPDALALTWDHFRELLKDKQGPIKLTLMDQRCFAGIGNIYSDEILFQARLHPQTKVERLGTKTLRGLYTTMRRV